MTDRKRLGLYLHLPFCKRRCAYCDFCSSVGREGDIPAYVDALLAEMCRRPAPGYTVDTVYLGGGTPSLLPPEETERLLAGIHRHYRVDPLAEITCEVNPCTVDFEKFSLLRSFGINRVSIGVQSLSDRALAALGRLHTASEAVAAYRDARRAGFDNVSMDLMLGLPGETPRELAGTVEEMIALAPEHISAYALMLEEGTPLFTSPLCESIPGDDEAADAMEATAARLAAAGYRRYEISNYAQEGRESRHNLRYWRGEEYVGLGVAAYSYFEGERFGAPRDLDGYLAGRILPRVDVERLDHADREAERVMLSLRLADGIDRAAYLRDFGRDPHLLFSEVLSRYPAYFVRSDSAVALTGKGMNVSNTLIAECLACLA
ncbi:MAG: radical SAM family heme chaperone HemW [Clostridia bacterium]|nr:radical SAM family heme chaperone HemW [Clostridia bacterium]